MGQQLVADTLQVVEKVVGTAGDGDSLSTQLALGALVVNVIGLAVVLWQGLLARDAARAAQESVRDNRKQVLLDRLPEAISLIHVISDLSAWEREIEVVLRTCREIRETHDASCLKELVVRARRSSRGVVIRAIFVRCPPWLQQIYASGGTHYVAANGWLSGFWNDIEGRPTFSDLDDFGVTGVGYDVALASLHSIRELRELLDNSIPRAFLDTPANLSDLKLFDTD